MEIASILINTAANTLSLIYGVFLFKSLFDKLNFKFPNETNLKLRMHLSFGLMLLTGFAVAIGTREWFSWFIWISIFIMNLVEFKRFK